MSEIAIREASEADRSSIARLLSELGYPRTSEFVMEKLSELSMRNDLVLVATMGGEVVGFLGFHAIPLMHDVGMLGRITVLVIDSRFQRLGAGKKLITEAEKFARDHHCRRMEVTSGSERDDAHAFYKHLGYEPVSQR